MPLAPPAAFSAPNALPQEAARLASVEGRLAAVENATQRAQGSAGRADALLVAFAARRAVDRGLALRQEPKGSLAAIVSGGRDTAESRLASAAGKSLPLRRAGQARIDSLATSDGAPLLAPARGIKLTHLVGFGLTAAFYAPAIARQLVGRATEDEVAWFASHGATRGNLRLNVAEFRAELVAVPA